MSQHKRKRHTVRTQGSKTPVRRRAGSTLAARDEFSRVAKDPDRQRAWRRRSPVLIALLVALPLLFLSIRFSLMAASYLKVMAEIEVDNGTLVVLWLYSAVGWLGLAATLAALFIALAKKTLRWRVTWSVIAVLAAAMTPLSWTFFFIG